MTPIRSSTTTSSSDSLKQNQTSNGVYPVRLQPLTCIKCLYIGQQAWLLVIFNLSKLEVGV